MKDDLKNLIQQHLPAMAAGEMKAYLEKAEQNEVALKQALETVESQKKTITSISAEIATLKANENAVTAKKAELDEREKALNLKDFNLKLEELKYQLQAEKESKQSIFNLVQTFVANPRAIEVTTRNRVYSHNTDYSPSGGTTHYPTSSWENETKEFKEEK